MRLSPRRLVLPLLAIGALSFAFLSLAPGRHPTPQRSIPRFRYYRVADHRHLGSSMVNVRAGPSLASDVVQQLKPGTVVMARHDVKHNADDTFWVRVHVVGQAAPSGDGSGDEGGPGGYVMLVTKDGAQTLIHHDGASSAGSAAAAHVVGAYTTHQDSFPGPNLPPFYSSKKGAGMAACKQACSHDAHCAGFTTAVFEVNQCWFYSKSSMIRSAAQLNGIKGLVKRDGVSWTQKTEGKRSKCTMTYPPATFLGCTKGLGEANAPLRHLAPVAEPLLNKTLDALVDRPDENWAFSTVLPSSVNEGRLIAQYLQKLYLHHKHHQPPVPKASNLWWSSPFLNPATPGIAAEVAAAAAAGAAAKLPPPASASLATQVLRCTAPTKLSLYRNRSCLFRNMYLSRYGHFTAHVLREDAATFRADSENLELWGRPMGKGAYKFNPLIVEHADEAALRAATAPAEPRPGLSAYFLSMWSFNIAHALLDGLYPLVAGLVRLGLHPDEPIHLLVDSEETAKDADYNETAKDRKGRSRSYGQAGSFFRAVAGKGGSLTLVRPKFQQLWQLAKATPPATSAPVANYGKFLRYELFATGSGHRGQGFWSAEYNLRDARYALPVMRRRIWAHAGVIQPERHCCHRSISINGGGSVRGSVQQQQQQQQPPCEGVRDLVRVIVVQNKRYSPAEVDVIQRAIVALELEDKRAVAAKNGTLSRIDIKYINWKGLPRMRDQVGLLATTDVYVSGPGTGLLLHPFLGDGSVVVNLGCRRNFLGQMPAHSKAGVPSYMEENIAASLPNQQALYYDRCKYAELKDAPLRALLRLAVATARQGCTADSSSGAITFTSWDTAAGQGTQQPGGQGAQGEQGGHGAHMAGKEWNRSPVARAFVEAYLPFDAGKTDADALVNTGYGCWPEDMIFEATSCDIHREGQPFLTQVRMQRIRQQFGLDQCADVTRPNTPTVLCGWHRAYNCGECRLAGQGWGKCSGDCAKHADKCLPKAEAQLLKLKDERAAFQMKHPPVHCGGNSHTAPSCNACVSAGKSPLEQKTYCNGDCVWRVGKCVRPAAAVPAPKPVHCGGTSHTAPSCKACVPAGKPRLEQETYCNGDCVWRGGDCKLPTKTAAVYCGGHYAVSCGACHPAGRPAEEAPGYCNGECSWSAARKQCIEAARLMDIEEEGDKRAERQQQRGQRNPKSLPGQ